MDQQVAADAANSLAFFAQIYGPPPDSALVGKALLRSEGPYTCGDVSWAGIGPTGAWFVAGVANVETSVGAVPCCLVRPGYRDIYNYWRFWDEKTLYAPMAYVRANYHPVAAVNPEISPTPYPSQLV
jgi:hypothetical protein